MSLQYLKDFFICVRDQFRLGGGGGAQAFCPNFYVIHCLPKNQVVLPEYYVCVLAPKWPFLKFLGAAAPSPPPPRLVRLWISFSYRCCVRSDEITGSLRYPRRELDPSY